MTKVSGVVNTNHKYGYGYKPKYMTRVDKLDYSLNTITKAQWDTIKSIERYTDYRFEGTKEDASKFIADHIEEVRLAIRESYVETSSEDKKLLKRGVAKEDLTILRKIEEVTGLSFSEYPQNRGEAYRFIEEHRGCLA